MSPFLSRLAGRLALCLALLVSTASAWAQPLPTDPRLVTGELENGLRYIVRRHDNPPGRASVWLNVATGSLNETDRQRGIAHYLEHMAFNGSQNFAPNSVIPFFESLGLSFGQHQNAFTSFDQTTYQLALPDNTPATLDKGLLFMSDVASRLSLLPAEIEEERGIILEERRTRLSGRQRVQEYFLENLIPGSIFGKRLPIGTEETIKGVQEQDFRDYYGAFYVPSNMTLMIVADMDPAAVVEQITRHFSGGVRAERPVRPDIGVAPYTQNRAIVASDAELTDAQIGLIWVGPAIAPTTTREVLRERSIDGAAAWIFNRRLQQKVAEGKVSFHGGGASTDDLFRAAQLSMISVRGEPAKWRDMLKDIATEVQRARLHGFTDQEVADATKEVIAQAEREVEIEATLPARSLLSLMNSSVASEEPIMSAEQSLELAREIAPTITAGAASARFRELFDTGRPLTFSIQLPTDAEVPTEAQLVELGVAALGVQPENDAVADRPTELLKELPEAGTVAESALHEDSGVTSAWLGNGVRVHVRPMDYRKDEVTVTIAFAGGEIEETAANRGISQAASIAWSRPATGTLSSTNIRDLMTGRKVSTGGGAGADAMVISVRGSTAELETGMQLAYLLMTDPVVEPAAFSQWAERQKQGAAMRKMMPEGVLSDLTTETLHPAGEVRVRSLEPEQIDALSAEAAQAWLRRILAAAPVEVTVVGDIDAERAMELVKRYVGSLPARERIGKETLASLRSIPVPVGPLSASKTVKTRTDKAAVLSGFFGTDYHKLRDVRLLSTASRILSTRAIDIIREKKQLAYSPQVGSSPAAEYPGHGMVFLTSSTAPDKVESLLRAVEDLYRDFSEKGPTDEEMTVAKLQVANILDEQMREPSYWTRVLSSLTYRDISLDDVLAGPAVYQSFTADDVRDAFNRYYRPEARFAMHVSPEAAADPDPGEAPADGAR